MERLKLLLDFVIVREPWQAARGSHCIPREVHMHVSLGEVQLRAYA